MNKNKRWGIEHTNTNPIHVVLFISRNKDNKHVDGFCERRESFITTRKWDDNRLISKFKSFCECGLDGEFCRYYYSVNSRDPELIRREFMKFLIDSPEFNLCAVESKLAGIAATSACSIEKKWLFDFDIDDVDSVTEFKLDIIQNSNLTENDIKTYKTPNGFAIIVDHGFDTRKLMVKWGNSVGLKRDDVLLVMWCNGDTPCGYFSSNIIVGKGIKKMDCSWIVPDITFS